MIISHAVGPFREREMILGYLDAIGVQRDSIVTGRSRLSSSAYLYDLSNPRRLRAASAETHILAARELGIRKFPRAPGPMKLSDAWDAPAGGGDELSHGDRSIRRLEPVSWNVRD